MLPRLFNLRGFNLFNNELRLLIQPDMIELLQIKVWRGFKPQLIKQKTIQIQNENSSEVLSESWQSVVARLQAELKGGSWHAPKAKVILSNHFVRYTVVPWNNQLNTQEERNSYLVHCFNQAYGEAIKSWDMQMDQSAYGCPALASAIPGELLTALNDIFIEAKVSLLAVHPYLMQVANLAFDELMRRNLGVNFWLATIENGRLCLSRIQDGKWLLVRNLPAEPNTVNQIETLIERETLLACVGGVNKFGNHKTLPILIHCPQATFTHSIEIKNHRSIKLKARNQLATSQPISAQSMHWAIL